jgi:hypothetical protein
VNDQGPVWADEDEVDAGWAPPQLVDFGQLRPQRPRRSRWVTRGLPVLIVVAVLLIVWILGGFKTRGDRVTQLKVGQRFTNGAFVMTLDSATIQRKKNYDKDNPYIQDVVVHGTAKNIWTESTSPYGDWFAATNTTRQTVKEGNLVNVDYGDDAPISTPDDLTPGLPAMPITIDFEFPDSFRAEHVLVAMEQIDYRNHSITSTSEEKTWGNANTGYFRVTLPVKRLAAEDEY